MLGRPVLSPPRLRGYQERALQAWAGAGGRGVVVLPTGAGKTYLALGAVARTGRPALVLVPTRVLLHQWAEVLRRHTSGAVGVFGDGQRTTGPVTVCTFESAYRHLDQELGGRFSLVVVDEVHHFRSGARAEALETCTAPWRLGLTATLPDDPAATTRLTELVGPRVFSMSVAQLSGTYLAPFRILPRYLELDPVERRAYDLARGLFSAAYRRFCRLSGGTARWSEFLRAALASEEGRRAVRAYHETRRLVACARAKLAEVERLLRRHQGDRVLIFCADNRATYAISTRLLIPAITCDIGRAERQRILDGLRQGRFRALVSAQVLNEGIDLPDARVGVVVGGTQGGREHVQRVGRLLRPQRHKRAIIHELIVRDTYEVHHAEARQLHLLA